MAKKMSESNKLYFAGYNPEKQRQTRKDKHLKNHPNDGQAKNAKATQRRTAPNNKGGWLTRDNASKVYIGAIAGKDDQPINVLNAMTSSEQKQMAQYAAKLRKIHNRLQYESKKPQSKTSNLGYAG